MNSKVYQWLLNRISRSIPSMIFITMCSVAASTSSVLFALGTRNVIDTAVSGDKIPFIRACVIQLLIIISILFFNMLLQHLKERMRAVLDKIWKANLLHSLVTSEYGDVSKFHSAELINRMNNDVRILDDALVDLVPNLFAMLTRLVVALVILSALTPWLSLGLLAAGIVVILATSILRRYLKTLHKRVSEADGRVFAILQETLEKLLAVQAMGITGEIEKRASILLGERFVLHKKRKNLSLLTNASISILYYGAGFVALVFCSAALLSQAITFGTMTAVIQLVNQLQGPLVGLSGILPLYTAASAAAERLFEIDTLPKTETVPLDTPNNIYSKTNSIIAKNLTFSYGADTVLECAEFTLNKGSFCVVTGPSGTGKSTLLKLLLGIYTPSDGELFLQCNDQNIPINSSTRNIFAYVPQGNFIFSGSIKDNLLVVKPNATQEEIQQAVYTSAMDNYVYDLPDGLDTIIGENGIGLSEGQIQRIAIARAVICDAPILLLDECTSALDAYTESLVLHRLRELNNKTCIAVTHRSVSNDICTVNLKIDNKSIRM